MKENVNELILHLEALLLQPNIRNSYDDLNEILAEGFVEFGSSGKIYDKETAIASMLNEQHSFDAEIEDFRIKPLAANVILATYKLRVSSHTLQRKSFSLRSSIWRFEDSKWQLVFHQGTLTQEF
jgi:hypothetical protein